MSVDFTPSRGNYTELKPFRYWCQKVLPLVYDDSLSYYELLSKILDALNKAMEDVETLNDDVTALYEAYTALQNWVTAYAENLQNWVNNYVETFFEGEGIADAVDAGIDRMVVSGEFGSIVNDKVAAQINAVVASQLGTVVQGQLPSVVQAQINPVVANQLPGVVNNKIGDVADAWLGAHVQSQTGTLDHTINSSGSSPLSFPLKNLIQGVKGAYSFIDKYLLADYTNTGYHNDVIIFRNIFKDNFNPPDYPYPARSKFYKKGNTLVVTSYPDPNNDNPWEINAYPSVIPITRNLIPPMADNWDASTNDAVALTLSGLSGLDKNAINKYFVNINSGDTIKVAFDLNLTHVGDFNGFISLEHWKLIKVYVSNNAVTSQDLAEFTITADSSGAGTLLSKVHGECEYTFGDIDKETPGNPNTIGFGLAIVTGENISWGHYSGNTNYMARSNTYDMTITGEVVDTELAELKASLGDTISEHPVNIGTIVSDEYITDNGSFASYGGWSRTDYIDCSTWTAVRSNSNTSYNAFYDENHNFISRCIFTSEIRTVPVPGNAKYVAFSNTTVDMSQWNLIAYIKGMGYDLYSKIDDLNDVVNTDSYIYPTEIIQDAFISSTGSLTTNASGYIATPYLSIPFNEFQSFQIRGCVYGSACCCIYDADHNLLLAITENNRAQYGGVVSSELQILTIPYIDGMKYARLSARTNDYSSLTDLWTCGNTIAGAFERIDAIESDIKTINGIVSTAVATSKVLVIGDSISADAYGNYPKWVTDLINEGFLPTNTTNSSQHATGFVARYDNQPNDFITRLKAIENPSQYDLVIVFGGINDYIQNIPMGNDTGTDYTVSFKPAVNEFFSYLINNFTQARLCVLLPLRNYQNWQNSVGEYQQAYGEYIKQVAKSYSLPILNLTEESGFCPYISAFSDMWTLIPQGYSASDGTHPNELYERKYLAPMIKNFLQGLM